ncbi:metalloprotease family M12A [Thraustotheca clavata]|nr:metalloprotease family M12A [Thraustotheca clavata]
MGLYGQKYREGQVKHIFGQSGIKGSIYRVCINNTLVCKEENGLADAPDLPTVDCAKAAARRRLGLVLDPVKVKLWPNATMCYNITDTKFTKKERKYIKQAAKHIHTKTSVDIITLAECQAKGNANLCGNCKDYVAVTKEKPGCFAAVGYQASGAQVLNVEKGCFKAGMGRIAHEFLHAIGFYHEHVHPNRKIIILQNELKVARNNYILKKDAVDTTYDFVSIMHYSSEAGVCIPKQKNIVYCDISQSEEDGCVVPSRDDCDEKASKVLGQRKGLSKIDINTVGVLYGNKKKGTKATIKQLRAKQKKQKKAEKKKTKKSKTKLTSNAESDELTTTNGEIQNDGI